MYIFVDDAGCLTLLEQSNFNALKLVSKLPGTALAAALEKSAAGSVADAGHAWISQQWLRAQMPPADERWAPQFDRMMAYARAQGWVQPESDAVRVHVDFNPHG